jgi:oxygen-independent coproporphyrinogen-3 oxidase
MDHFALPHDELAKAMNSKTLHRNFMGYTTQSTPMMIGLGMSSISDSWFGFAQNEKSVEDYIQRVSDNKLPVFRGHLLTDEDVIIRRHILDLMCHFETTIESDSITNVLFSEIISRLTDMIEDKLVLIDEKTVKITEKGIPFVRNCCMAFDQDLHRNKLKENLFSKTI